jgi:hypothetical protein
MKTSSTSANFRQITGQIIVDTYEMSAGLPVIKIKGKHECAVVLKMYYSDIEGKFRFFARVITDSGVRHQIEIHKDKHYQVAIYAARF